MSAKTVEVDFNEENGFFILQLRKEDVGLGTEPIQFQGKTFQPKDEVHITIFGSRLSEELAAKMADEVTLGPELRALIEQTAWEYELHDEWYHVVDGEEETIIQMAGVPPLEEFYRQVTALADVEIPERPTHVTMYTFNSPDGIGIATEEAFKELVVGELTPEYIEE